jgi:peptidyl-tRNA hydrolase, PTH1 family
MHILVPMQYVVAGLGNPGEEYENTRHNVGRMVVECVARMLNAPDWRDDKTLRARVANAGTDTGDTATLVLPDNYMNRSGGSIAPLVKNSTQAEHLIVVHDDIDLPLGTIRIVFNRGSGGHRGVDSIIRAIKTRAFVRVRVGVVPTTPTGKIRKPAGDEAVHTFILKQLSSKDREAVQTVVERAADAVVTCITEGASTAMQQCNGDVGGVVKKRTPSKK